jgi:hypothetical protein
MVFGSSKIKLESFDVVVSGLDQGWDCPCFIEVASAKIA